VGLNLAYQGVTADGPTIVKALAGKPSIKCLYLQPFNSPLFASQNQSSLFDLDEQINEPAVLVGRVRDYFLADDTITDVGEINGYSLDHSPFTSDSSASNWGPLASYDGYYGDYNGDTLYDASERLIAYERKFPTTNGFMVNYFDLTNKAYQPLFPGEFTFPIQPSIDNTVPHKYYLLVKNIGDESNESKVGLTLPPILRSLQISGIDSEGYLIDPAFEEAKWVNRYNAGALSRNLMVFRHQPLQSGVKYYLRMRFSQLMDPETVAVTLGQEKVIVDEDGFTIDEDDPHVLTGTVTFPAVTADNPVFDVEANSTLGYPVDHDPSTVAFSRAVSGMSEDSFEKDGRPLVKGGPDSRVKSVDGLSIVDGDYIENNWEEAPNADDPNQRIQLDIKASIRPVPADIQNVPLQSSGNTGDKTPYEIASSISDSSADFSVTGQGTVGVGTHDVMIKFFSPMQTVALSAESNLRQFDFELTPNADGTVWTGQYEISLEDVDLEGNDAMVFSLSGIDNAGQQIVNVDPGTQSIAMAQLTEKPGSSDSFKFSIPINLGTDDPRVHLDCSGSISLSAFAS
jgi:hypothetical protein